MAKVGRNDPCPCGSGRKFKKCCGGGRESSPPAASIPAKAGLVMHPYVMARLVEDPRLAGEDTKLLALMRRGWKENWTRSKLAAMTTEQIEAQLVAYGVEFSRERFLAQAAKLDPTRSAWRIGDEWLASDPVLCKGKDQDFLGLAACELWKRLVPGEPSFEQIDDWVQDGYALQEQSRILEACEAWWKAWEVLRSRMAPDVTDMQSLDTLFPGTQSIYNWAQDFEMALGNAAALDHRDGCTAWAARGARFCEEWIQQFTGEDDVLQVNVRVALADFLFSLGQGARAEALLREVVETWPDNPWGYVALADAHSHLWEGASTLPLDFDEALRWLALGQSRVPPEERSVFEERKEEIQERILAEQHGFQCVKPLGNLGRADLPHRLVGG